MISTPVVLAVLASALMHATWNFLVKSSRDKLFDTVSLALGGSLVAACLLPWVALPTAASFQWMAMSTCIHVAYYVTLIRAYQHADLSLAYPLMRGLAPVIVATVAPLFGEPASLSLFLGVALVGAGIILPATLGFRAGAISRVGLAYGVANSLIIALYTMIDGTGVRLSGSAVAYTAWLFFFNSWGILAVAVHTRGPQVLTHVRQRWRFSLVGAVLSVGSYGVVLWAMTVSPIAAVAALRETSVIFAALMGTKLLRERMGRPRIGGALLIALGAAVIRWA